LNQWTAVATNTFDSSGQLSFTNGLSGNAKQAFYRLQMN
jgi:hypothetical protein